MPDSTSRYEQQQQYIRDRQQYIRDSIPRYEQSFGVSYYFQESKEVTSRYNNGQLKEKYHTKKDCNGSFVKEGLYESWYLNGMKESEVTFKHNKREGKARFWGENGQLLEEDVFANDTLRGHQF